MHVTVVHKAQPFQFEAVNDRGNVIHMDSPPEGEAGAGPSPMQLLLMGLGGCSGIDIVHILGKKRIQPTLLRAEVEADREAGKTPSLFTAIRVHYDVEGDMEVKHLRQAIELSVEKYCSVGLMLGKAAPISYTFSLNGEHFDS